MTEPCDLSALEARRCHRQAQALGRRAPGELSRAHRATNGAVNAFVAMDADAARKRAKDIEQAIGRGEELGLLAGLPIGIKDLQATAGLRTTLGSLLYKDHVPAEDEFGVANIRKAGGVVLGKTNTPEFGAGANTPNRVYGANRQSVRSVEDLRRLLGRLGGGAGAGPGAAGDRLGPRRQPAHAGRLLRRGRFPALARACARRRSRRALSPLQRHGADGPLRGGHASAAPRADRPRHARSVLVGRQRAHPGQADGRRSRAAQRRRVGRSRLRAGRQGHRRDLPRARRAVPPRFREVEERAPDFGRRARDVRDLARRAVRRRAPRAPGELARAARPQRHRQHRARHEDVARRREPRACGADQALQALPRLLPRGRRADLPGRLRLAVPARAAVRGGDQRRADADLHALARHHLRADHGAGVPWRCPAAWTTRACRSASR